MINTAVIMAAGLGSRFGKMTETTPKGFIEVGGIPMIIRSIENLLSCGITNIIIGTGFRKEAFEALISKYPQVKCIYSQLYRETNSMYTLYNCKEAISNNDFLLLESDIIYSRNAITSLLENEHKDIMLITPERKFQDQYYIEYDKNNILRNCSTNKTSINSLGELVGIHKISSNFYLKMCTEYAKEIEFKKKIGYEYQILEMSQNHIPVYVLNSNDVIWYEIDDEQDLKYAEENIIIKL